ncbi:MAG: hypothetical protein IPK74_29270 [Deltaproteobacteria bacterium]|nr:hypothetical protein [Deltaproteobacteria bacterium]
MRRCILILAAALACSTDLPAPGSHADSSAGPTTEGGSGSGSGDSTTAAPEPVELFDATLDLELKQDVRVTVTQTGDDVTVSAKLSRGYGLVADGTTLTGSGRVDAYPELGATGYTARFDVPADAGLCGGEVTSIGLSLFARVYPEGADDHAVYGGLTAYCGGDDFGVPVIEPLRISGRR